MTHLTKRIAITAGAILAVGIISLSPWRLNAQTPGAPPVAEVQFTNQKDALHWQLALVRNERLKARKAVLDAEYDLLSAHAEVNPQPNSAELHRKLDRTENAFEIARQQEANWTNEVARLEARLKEIGGQAPSAPPAAANAERAAKVQSANENDALYWQLAQGRNEVLKARNAVASGEVAFLRASETQKAQPSKQTQAEVDRAASDLSLAKNQMDLWSKEVARLEAKLKEAQVTKPRPVQTASGPNAPVLENAPEYRTVLVAKGPLTQVVTATGTLNPLPNDRGKWQINALVTEADIVRVDVGQAVAFTHDAFPDRAFHGKVVQVGTKAVVEQNVVCYDTGLGSTVNGVKTDIPVVGSTVYQFRLLDFSTGS